VNKIITKIFTNIRRKTAPSIYYTGNSENLSTARVTYLFQLCVQQAYSTRR